MIIVAVEACTPVETCEEGEGLISFHILRGVLEKLCSRYLFGLGLFVVNVISLEHGG